MRGDREELAALASLHTLESAEERRATFRKGLATLAAYVDGRRRLVPLEGLPPAELEKSATVALREGLFEDLEWLSAPGAAGALYELSAALPTGGVKRELYRRVARRLFEGNASTFVALATQLALGSPRTLRGTPIQARVELCLELPLIAGARVDRLALALVSRRELQREWLLVPATGSLSERRLAARLLERAAREAAERAAVGDEQSLRVFETPAVSSTWESLLADRESLVWRHAAAARGLLASHLPELERLVHRDLDAGASPTEWRRGAASIAASLAITPQHSFDQLRVVLTGGLVKRDAGIAAAVVLGLPRAAEVEPEVVGEVLDLVVAHARIDVAEALVDLRREHIGATFANRASELLRAKLAEDRALTPATDDGYHALSTAIETELSADTFAARTLRTRLSDATLAFATHDAKHAFNEAQSILRAARSEAERLAACDESTAEGRRYAFQILRELDLALTETNALRVLLLLGVQGDDTSTVLQPLDGVFARLTDYLVKRETEPKAARGTPHDTFRARRLRTLLHVIDADGAERSESTEVRRGRRGDAARMLLRRIKREGPSPIRRILCAAVARASDAMLREEMAQISDVLIALANHARLQEDLETFVEASMVPDLKTAVKAYASLAATVAKVGEAKDAGVRLVDALRKFGEDLPVEGAPRVEAMRASILELERALAPLLLAHALRDLGSSRGGAPFHALEDAADGLARLVLGAERRLDLRADGPLPRVGAAVRLLDFAVERAARGSSDDLEEALETCEEAMRLELPPAIAEVIVRILSRLRALPMDDAKARGGTGLLRVARKRAAPLPTWMPPSRTLGGFRVLRAIGTGAAGTVFVARRIEDRDREDAELFALKVPEYDGTAARTLSEDEFLALFRSEAGALLTVPPQQNLARFVTFDAGARPKPILVMELVEGYGLDRFLELDTLDVPTALDLLDGVASGLDTMHAVGVGHLDVKPGNVILRRGPGKLIPVLVDFGLAGKTIRPGCATTAYGAPEIWAAKAGTDLPPPMPSDVYALGCLAFEILTGKTLFQAPHELATIAQHLAHDGVPPAVEPLLAHPSTTAFGELIYHCIRRDPAERLPIRGVRAKLATLKRTMTSATWPLLGQLARA